MNITINNKTKEKINQRLLRRVAEEFFKKNKKSLLADLSAKARASAEVLTKASEKEVSVAFVSEAVIRRLNRIYRGIDKPTDILTFAGEGNFLGEILINYKLIKKQARESGVGARDELIFILAHGLLHLMGYKDNTEAGRIKMIKKGEEFIRKFKKNKINKKIRK